MLDTLIAWLNGTRDYTLGARLYSLLGKDEKLKALFAQDKTLYSNFRLQEELKAICKDLKADKNGKNKNSSIEPGATSKPSTIRTKKPAAAGAKAAGGNETKGMAAAEPKQPADVPANDIPSAVSTQDNEDLYRAAKTEADIVYKEYSNKRAVLFSMVPDNKYENPNAQDLVETRKPLALEVLKLHRKASELYDRADYVKLHGRLPDQDEPDISDEVASLQPHEVKPALDNARKALNKLEKKEQTAERLVLAQNHKDRIKQLEARWHSLKQGT